MGRSRKENRGFRKIACLALLCGCAVAGNAAAVPAAFPEQYQAVQGNVEFDCHVVFPEDLDQDFFPELLAETVWGNKEREEELFVQGNEILEQYGSEASRYVPEKASYMLADGTWINTGGAFTCTRPTAKYYGELGLLGSYEGAYVQKFLDWGEPETYIREAEKLLKDIGFPEGEYRFNWVSFDAGQMERLEKERLEAYLIKPGDEKGTWTQEDEIYILYGWQYERDCPVLTQYMGVDKYGCLDRMENAPVVLVYSSRGLEYARIINYYQFQESGKGTPLLDLEDAAGTLEEKLNSILGDNHYLVTQAKFFVRVKRNKEQSLTVEPVWRFDITENGSEQYAVLINAVTGKESYFS